MYTVYRLVVGYGTVLFFKIVYTLAKYHGSETLYQFDFAFAGSQEKGDRIVAEAVLDNKPEVMVEKCFCQLDASPVEDCGCSGQTIQEFNRDKIYPQVNINTNRTNLTYFNTFLVNWICFCKTDSETLFVIS